MQSSSHFANQSSSDRQAVLAGVTSVVGEHLGISPESISEQHLLTDDLGCDSLDLVEISMQLEEHFDISIPDEFAENIGTIGKVTDGVIALLGNR